MKSKGRLDEKISVMDVTPTILELLDLKIPLDMDGQAVRGLTDL